MNEHEDITENAKLGQRLNKLKQSQQIWVYYLIMKVNSKYFVEYYRKFKNVLKTDIWNNKKIVLKELFAY